MMKNEIVCAEPWASNQPAALSDQRASFDYQNGTGHLKTLGHGRGGAQRKVDDPHEIPRGALLIDSGLFR